MSDGDYVFDEISGEWIPAGQMAAPAAGESGPVEVRDAVGNLLSDGDQGLVLRAEFVRKKQVRREARSTVGRRQYNCGVEQFAPPRG